MYADDELIPKNTTIKIKRFPACEPKKKYFPYEKRVQNKKPANECCLGNADLSSLQGSESDKIQAMINQSSEIYRTEK